MVTKKLTEENYIKALKMLNDMTIGIAQESLVMLNTSSIKPKTVKIIKSIKESLNVATTVLNLVKEKIYEKDFTFAEDEGDFVLTGYCEKLDNVFHLSENELSLGAYSEKLPIIMKKQGVYAVVQYK